MRKILCAVSLTFAALCAAYLVVFANLLFWNTREYMDQHDWLGSLAGSCTVIGIVFFAIGAGLHKD